MKARRAVKKRYWRDALWFVAGTFLGGWVFGIFARVLGKA